MFFVHFIRHIKPWFKILIVCCHKIHEKIKGKSQNVRLSSTNGNKTYFKKLQSADKKIKDTICCSNIYTYLQKGIGSGYTMFFVNFSVYFYFITCVINTSLPSSEQSSEVSGSSVSLVFKFRWEAEIYKSDS